MRQCDACEIAETDPLTGRFNDCERCRVRALAQAPKAIRLAAYERINDPHERQAFKELVQAEHKRFTEGPTKC